MNTDQKIYEGFIAWLRTSWGHLPDSDELLPMISEAYTLDDAKLLTGIPFQEKTLAELATLKNLPETELEMRLDDLACRGLIFRVKKDGIIHYRLADARFVFLRSFFWPGTDTEQGRAVAKHVNQYYRDGFGDNWKGVHTKGLRALPIKQTIDDPRRILPYEDVVKVLEDQNRFAVATCACRQRQSLDDSSENTCTHEKQNCLHFGNFADYIIENGLGKEITQSEAEKILHDAAEEGLVHGISNWQKDVDTICNCCSCCCLYMEAFHVLGHAKGMNQSNYEVRINEDTCKGCGLCEKRCPMEGIALTHSERANNRTGKIASLEPGICIGCGVCAHKCPTESLSLSRRATLDHPPENVKEQRKRFFEEKAALKSQEAT